MITRILAFGALASLVSPATAQTGTSIQPLEQWMIEVGAPGGVVKLSGKPHRGYYRAYECSHFAAAEAVVGAILDGHHRRVTSHAQTAMLKSALRRFTCSPARGAYRVNRIGREVEINHGQESSENWTALSASTASNVQVGLVFDSSPYAIKD